MFEVSLVSVPANSEAKALNTYIAKSLSIEKEENLQKSLMQQLEILAGKLTGEQKKVIDDVISFFKTTNLEDNEFHYIVGVWQIIYDSFRFINKCRLFDKVSCK